MFYSSKSYFNMTTQVDVKSIVQKVTQCTRVNVSTYCVYSNLYIGPYPTVAQNGTKQTSVTSVSLAEIPKVFLVTTTSHTTTWFVQQSHRQYSARLKDTMAECNAGSESQTVNLVSKWLWITSSILMCIISRT